jgi:hypothetical protein
VCQTDGLWKRTQRGKEAVQTNSSQKTQIKPPSVFPSVLFAKAALCALLRAFTNLTIFLSRTVLATPSTFHTHHTLRVDCSLHFPCADRCPASLFASLVVAAQHVHTSVSPACVLVQLRLSACASRHFDGPAILQYLSSRPHLLRAPIPRQSVSVRHESTTRDSAAAATRAAARECSQPSGGPGCRSCFCYS